MTTSQRSNLKGPQSDEDRGIALALVFDAPRLTRLPLGGGAEFVAVFGSSPRNVKIADAVAASALGIAAAGIRAERTGDKEAVAFYDQLAGTPWRDLLRFCLRGWSSFVQGTEDILAAAHSVETLQDRTALKALLLTKLSILAADKGDRELFQTLLRRAQRNARKGSRLRSLLDIEAYNALEDTQALSGLGERLPPGQRLVDRDWIDDRALRGAQLFLNLDLAERARNPWSWTFRAGSTPLDEIAAADAQATWAGAAWQRRPIRRQLGAQILLGSPRRPEEAAQGLYYWLTSGGRDEVETIGFVEPVLDQEACDWLIRALASRVVPEASVLYSVARALRALWDCISDDLIPSVLDELPLAAGEHPLISDSRRVWVSLSTRAPWLVAPRLVGAEGETLRALALDMSEDALVVQSPATRSLLFEALREAEDLDENDSFRARAFLEKSLLPAKERTQFLLGSARPATVVELAEVDPERVRGKDLARAIVELAKALQASQLQALGGQWGLGGGPSTSNLLARAIVARGTAAPEEDALWEVALDRRVGGEMAIQALNGLALLALNDLVSVERFGALRSEPEPVSGHGPFGVGPEVVRAARLLVLSKSLSAQEELELAALGRASDPRARVFALNAAALALAERQSERLEQMVVTALFDPNDDVVRWGLRALLHERPVSLRGFDDVLARRVGELFGSRGRHTRATIVRAASTMRERLGRRLEIEAVLAAAARDKSWIVRSALKADYEHFAD